MFHDLAPVMGGFGLKMLKKMGWKEGEPLGIHGQGFLVPLAVDVKMDRSGELVVSEQCDNRELYYSTCTVTRVTQGVMGRA